MRHKPRYEYSGLTIVLSNPSRFDNHSLLTGTAGHYFETECLPLNKSSCDIRTSDTHSDGLLPNTKGILLLGDRAFQEWTGGVYNNYTLSEQRGSRLVNKWGNNSIITLASFGVQDAIDIVDHESRLNPLANGDDEFDYENEEGEDEYTTKKKGATRRSNWRFWLKQDTRKLCNAITSGGNCESRIAKCSFKICPSSREVLEFLQGIKEGENLYLDIETSIDGGYNIFCLGLATDDSSIFVVPFFDYRFQLFYSDTQSILVALARAFERATVVCHNGYAFDLFVLAWRYGIPIGRKHYDTMIAQHRCFPIAEKSLGHCLSLWTWEPYHKDEGIFTPHDFKQYRQLLEYNGKDVAGMRLVKWAIDSYAKGVPGLEKSILQGNRCVYPYLLCSLNGMSFNEMARQAKLYENDKLMTHYLGMIRRFTEHLKYDGTLLPTSSPSCVKFFHSFLNYDVVARSRSISKKTGKPLNTPSLNEKAFWKLKLKYPDNALIDICVRYRQVKKDSGMLKFTPWDFYGTTPISEAAKAKNEEDNILFEESEDMEE